LEKVLLERRRNVSIISGVSYRYWKNDNLTGGSSGMFGLGFQENYITIMPIGVNFHRDKELIRPYAYLAVGFLSVIATNHEFSRGDKTSIHFLPFPVTNLGVGARIKAGSGLISIELTPYYEVLGTFLNIGYSFP